jgi:hypothetical protein
VLDNRIQRILAENDDLEVLRVYDERTKEHDDWNVSRKAFEVVVGDWLDVLDTEYVNI